MFEICRLYGTKLMKLESGVDFVSAQCSQKPKIVQKRFINLAIGESILRLNSSPYLTKNVRNENISQKCKQTSDSRKSDRISVFKLFLVVFRFVYFLANIFVSPFFPPN